MSEKDNVMTTYDVATATIAAGGTTTNTIFLGGLRLFAVGFGEAMTGTKLAVYVGVTIDDVRRLYDNDGIAIAVPVVAGGCVCCDPTHLAPWRYVKFVSNATESADHTLQLILRAV